MKMETVGSLTQLSATSDQTGVFWVKATGLGPSFHTSTFRCA